MALSVRGKKVDVFECGCVYAHWGRYPYYLERCHQHRQEDKAKWRALPFKEKVKKNIPQIIFLLALLFVVVWALYGWR